MAETKRSRQILMIGAQTLVCIVAASLIAGAVVGTRVFPCTSCHVMKVYAETGEDAPHSSIGCTACHLGDSFGGSLDLRTRVMTQMFPAMLLGVDHPEGPVGDISRDVCLHCHARVMDVATGAKGVAIDHAACAEAGTCVSCHGGTAHTDAVRWVRMYSMEECVVCHQKTGVPDACDTCHVGKSERERLAIGSWQVTHGSNWRETHGMGSVQSCSTCHPDNYCVDCHGTPLPHPANWGTLHGVEALADRDGCSTCHPDEMLCDTCHGLEMPHPDGFLEKHSGEATGVDDDTCAPCHLSDDCLECHENHIHPGGPNMPRAPASSSGGER